jgi:hypothetical protein
MKKLFGIFLAAMLLLGVAGQAMAAFSKPDLLRIVINVGATGNPVEVGTDLALSAVGIESTAANTVVGGGGAAFSRSLFGLSNSVASDWNNLVVTYFALGSGSSNQAWSTAETQPVGNTGSWSKAALNSVYNTGYFNGSAGGTLTVNKTDTGSYFDSMDLQGLADSSIGSLGLFLTPGQTSANFFGVEKSLADLATVGYVDQKLYYWATPNTNGTPVLLSMTIRTMADGSTVINPASAVPIPPGVLLFGSGLLGMIGIRRKISR